MYNANATMTLSSEPRLLRLGASREGDVETKERERVFVLFIFAFAPAMRM
jgi:hypothetical protein